MQQKLLELCQWLEPLVRPYGWHVAATGSALYGQSAHEPEDLDVLLYRHNGWKGTEWRPFDTLLAAGLRKLEDCTEYPEFELMQKSGVLAKEQNTRKVFRWISPDGTKVDFLCLEDS